MSESDEFLTSYGARLPVVSKRERPNLLDTIKARLPHGALGVMGALASVILFGLAAWVIGRTLSQISYADLVAAIAATSAPQILMALALTAASYVFLTGYDVVALRHIGAYSPYRVAALAAFSSFAISFNIGLPIVTSAVVRFWIYSRVALSAAQVATVTVFAGVTFWLGMTLMIGVSLIAGADALAALDALPNFLHVLLGAVIICGVGAYCVWAAIERRLVRIRGLEIALPGMAPTLSQLVLGAADLSCAAGALYVLLPAGANIDFSAFVAIYVFACVLGVISHAPGGIGVFEAVMLHAISAASQESMLASLLMFRVIYYFLPLVVALAILGADEGARRWASMREAISRIIDARMD